MDPIEQQKVQDDKVPEPITPEMEKAIAGGWKPLEEWEGNPEDWADHKEFNKRGEYIDHIKSLSSDYKRAQKKIARLEESFNQLSEHHAKVREVEYEKAMSDLKNLKKEALSNMDYDRVVEVDEKISELKETDPKKQPTPENTKQELPDELQSWMDENTWYDKDSILRGAANALIEDILRSEPHRKSDISGVLSEVTATMKKEFPNKLGTTRTRKSEILDVGDEPTSSQRGSQAPKNLARYMTEEQRKVATRFVKQGAFKNVEDYAKELYEVGEIKVRGV